MKEPRALPLGDFDGLTIDLLGPGLIPGSTQQIARHLMQQLSFKNLLIGSLNDPNSFGEAAPCFSGSPEHGERLRAT